MELIQMGLILYLAAGVTYAVYLKRKNNWGFDGESAMNVMLVILMVFVWPIVFLFRLGEYISQK